MIKDKTCSNCGAAFKCGATEPSGTCWCTALPNVVPITEGAGCLCPHCLSVKIKQIEHAKADIKQQDK